MPAEKWRVRITNLLAIATLLLFLFDAVGRSWSAKTSDFPNYYTAAALTLSGVPLERSYDYPEFQHAIGRFGFGLQLGGWIPQTPFAIVPFLPLARLSPVVARRVWIGANVVLLGATVWMLVLLTAFTASEVWLIAFLGYMSVRQNVYLGQYYILLLAIVTFGVYAAVRSREAQAGAAFASAFLLKLYGAPFLLFFMAKRRTKLPAAFATTCAIALGGAVLLFGLGSIILYASQVLPRSLAGETLNPFHPGNNTFSTFLRSWLIVEPELNPRPGFDAPWAFAFLRWSFAVLAISLPIIAASAHPGVPRRREMAWWIIAALLISPNTALYSFSLLITPVVLVMDHLPVREWLCILGPFVLVSLPLNHTAQWLFPRPWLLLILFCAVGLPFIRAISRRQINAAVLLSVSIGLVMAIPAAINLRLPATGALSIAVQPGALYSSSPAARSAHDVTYEALEGERYVIRNWHDSRAETFDMSGLGFHPSLPDSGDRVYVERFDGQRSHLAVLNAATHAIRDLPMPQPDPREPAVSHDGKLLAYVALDHIYLFNAMRTMRLETLDHPRDPSFAPGDRAVLYVAGRGVTRIVSLDLASGVNSVLHEFDGDLASASISPDGSRLVYAARHRGAWQVWMRDLGTPQSRPLTRRSCNSWAPTWAGSSSQLIFASDCNRGLNLPALWFLQLRSDAQPPTQ